MKMTKEERKQSVQQKKKFKLHFGKILYFCCES